MSKHSITIDAKTFDSKSKALEFYKNILSLYQVGEELCKEDFNSIIALFYRDCDKEEIRVHETESGVEMISVVVDSHPVFKTKCFFIIWVRDGEEEEYLFSYRLAINGALSDSQLFSRACRHLVSERLREFKKQRFKDRPVKCAVTNEVVEWEECQIDHKAPLTFSVIVKSFIVSHKIDVSAVEYYYEDSLERFVDEDIAEKFDAFHKEMAVLRVLATKQNNKLSGAGRITPTKKDGVLL